jgi:hypothetical protein
MKLPVDTSAIAFPCALAPEPVVDFQTRRPKADDNGEPLYLIQLLAMGDGSADLLAVKVPDVPSPAIRQGVPVKVTGLVAQPRTMADRSGSRSAPPGSSRPSPKPRPANRREGCPPSQPRAEGPTGLYGSWAGPSHPPGAVLATPDRSCIRSEPRDAP